MKRERYMSKNDMKNFMFIGAMAGQAAAIAEQTQEKDWRQKLKTVAKYLENITNERLQCLDKDQLLSVVRRRKGTSVVMVTEDAKRCGAEPEKELITADLEDLETVAELALVACQACKQGDIVQGCRFRLAFHKLGLDEETTKMAYVQGYGWACIEDVFPVWQEKAFDEYMRLSYALRKAGALSLSNAVELGIDYFSASVIFSICREIFLLLKQGAFKKDPLDELTAKKFLDWAAHGFPAAGGKE